MCVCLQTYNTKIYGVESRKLESISFVLEVLIQEVGPPSFIACDKEGSFRKMAQTLAGPDLGAGTAGTCPGPPHFRGPHKLKLRLYLNK